MSFHRVLPRDLFNEAKLLKCLGRLALLIHDGLRWPMRFEHNEMEYEGFHIVQNQDDGSLVCDNLELLVFPSPRKTVVVRLSTVYNSKTPYPLVWDLDDESGYVFSDDGSLSQEFQEFLDRLVPESGDQ